MTRVCKTGFLLQNIDYLMRSLLGLKVVLAVSRASSIPNILNANIQIPVMLICVAFVVPQNR